jgi:hypothetical protein
MECYEGAFYQRGSVTQKTMNYDTFLSLWYIISGITVHKLRIEGNYTSLPELMHRSSCDILNIQIT